MQQQICGIIEPSGVYVCSRGNSEVLFETPAYMLAGLAAAPRHIIQLPREVFRVIYIAYEQFEPQWATGVGSIRIGQQIFAYYFYQQYAQLGIDGARITCRQQVKPLKLRPE